MKYSLMAPKMGMQGRRSFAIRSIWKGQPRNKWFMIHLRSSSHRDKKFTYQKKKKGLWPTCMFHQIHLAFRFFQVAPVCFSMLLETSLLLINVLNNYFHCHIFIFILLLILWIVMLLFNWGCDFTLTNIYMPINDFQMWIQNKSWRVG